MKIERIDEIHLTPEDEARIHTLLVRAFEEPFGNRSFHQQRHHVRLIVRDGDAIIGHMSLCYRSIRMGEDLLPIMGLAEVATDPDHRGKGIASALMTDAIAEARGSQAVHFLLFGGQPLYAGRGFRSVPNTVKHTALYDAWTGDVQVDDRGHLMVMELRDQPWDDTAPVDLLGFSF
ncbi:GNAT family N-acetyltransferase [Yoonia sp. R2331]|uniref:GNAT family N-acetyltransferase n=1 Tax=Yoonia sp. R2331 TaxID=3237238 RepID=UPI0034E3C9BD